MFSRVWKYLVLGVRFHAAIYFLLHDSRKTKDEVFQQKSGVGSPLA